MVESTPTLEQVLERFGDDLYRLALLLTPDTAHAHTVLVRAASHLSEDSADLSNGVPFGALLAALPPERRVTTRRVPEWVAAHDPRVTDGRVLAAVARLPRMQRLALGVRALQIANLSALDAQLVESLPELRRDAQLALAAVAGFVALPAALTTADAPEDCKAARATLMLGEPSHQRDPMVRGHLALCAACRELSQEWLALSELVDETLRAVLREHRLPDSLEARMRAAGSPRQGLPRSWRAALANPWLLRTLLPLVVLAAILALVAPRASDEPSVPASAPTGAAPVDQHALVERAIGTLYQHGEGVTHEQYAMRWVFADGTYAPLVGEMWSDGERGLRRIQLTHESGGAPYEFLLNDSRGTVWYAVTRTYGESLYPLSFDPSRTRVRLSLEHNEERQLVDAVLQNGAWSLPRDYLQRAMSAQLQSWGSQRGDDGTLLEVIGFRSTRALTGSAPDGAIQTTVLLLIDGAEGRLHEIREVIGPQGGEQVTRTIWRRLRVETMEDGIARDRAFNLAFAWNGIGDFTELQQGLIRAELPLVDASLVVAPRDALATASNLDILAPAAAPPQSQAATLLVLNRQTNARWTVVYTGGTRRLAIQSVRDTPENEALFSTENGVETATIAGRHALVRAVPGGYEVLLRGTQQSQRGTLALVAARGYSHDELLQTLDSVRPLTLGLLESQARLFAASNLAPDARDVLVGALQPEALVEQGEVQQTTTRVFERHLSDVDPLGDPFHRPAYNGIPASVLAVDWYYPSEQAAPMVYGELQSDDGRRFASYYHDTRTHWLHLDTVGLNVDQLSPLELPGNKGRAALLSALMCGNARVVSQSGGTVLIESTEASWTARSCVRPELPGMLGLQQGSLRASGRRRADAGPFVADLGQQPLILSLWIADSALQKVELWGGTQNNGTLIESWERVNLRSLPASDIPPIESRRAMPPGVVSEPVLVASPFSTILLRSVDITDTVTLLGVALFDASAVAIPHHFMVLTSSTDPAVQVTVNVQSPQSSALDEALWQGLAVQSLVPVDDGRGVVTNVLLYQGATTTFGAFLRAHAEWKASAPVSFALAGQQVSGWSVLPGDDRREAYLLADVDGTLLAIRTPQSQREWQALNNLQRVGPSGDER